MECNYLSNFSRESSKKHSYEIISEYVHLFSRKSLLNFFCFFFPLLFWGGGGRGEGGAMVLGKLPVPGRPTYLDYSRARAYCACRRCGWECLDIFSLFYHFSFLSPSLWEMARYRLKYCLIGQFSPKTTNQPKSYFFFF